MNTALLESFRILENSNPQFVEEGSQFGNITLCASHICSQQRATNFGYLLESVKEQKRHVSHFCGFEQ